MQKRIPAVVAVLTQFLLFLPADCFAQQSSQDQQNQLSHNQLIESEVEEVLSGYGFTEGPLWLPSEKQFIFSDIPADTIFTENAKAFRKPSGKSNGLAFSPDEKVLYISDDIEDGSIRAFDVSADGSLSHPRVLAKGLIPDGMKVDVDGNVWCTSRYEVVVFRPDGSQLGSITFPQKTSNLAFGGEDSRMLLVTARSGVYRVRTKAQGIHPGSRKLQATKPG